jgi:hypothetical protein
MKSTGFRSREKCASKQTLKAEWDIGRYSEIFLLRNSKVTRRQGTTLQIEASRREHSPENTVIFMQLLTWFPCIFPIFDEVTRKMSNSDVQLEYQ